jgi:hypothetical protein
MEGMASANELARAEVLDSKLTTPKSLFQRGKRPVGKGVLGTGTEPPIAPLLTAQLPSPRQLAGRCPLVPHFLHLK